MRIDESKCRSALIVILGASGACGGVEGEEAAVLLQELTPGTTYNLVGVQSNRCMEIAGGSTADGAIAQLFDCNGSARQQFRFETASGGFFFLRNVGSNKCIDVTGNSLSNGADIIQWTCHGGNNQQWSPADLGENVVRLAARSSGQVLDAFAH